MTDSPTTRPSLLVRLRDPRDERAWGEFLDLYGPLIERLAIRRGLQPADAADLVQEVFRAVAAAIDRWDPDPARGSFRGWLFRTARNLSVKILAAQKRHPRGSGDSELQRVLEELPAPDEEAVTLFEGEYRRRLFAWAADRVQGEFRPVTWRAFWATGVEGEDPKHVAATLGITAGAVYIAKSRVMSRLKKEIEQLIAEDAEETP